MRVGSEMQPGSRVCRNAVVSTPCSRAYQVWHCVVCCSGAGSCRCELQHFRDCYSDVSMLEEQGGPGCMSCSSSGFQKCLEMSVAAAQVESGAGAEACRWTGHVKPAVQDTSQVIPGAGAPA